jgi:hypothetical protein
MGLGLTPPETMGSESPKLMLAYWSISICSAAGAVAGDMVPEPLQVRELPALRGVLHRDDALHGHPRGWLYQLRKVVVGRCSMNGAPSSGTVLPGQVMGER